ADVAEQLQQRAHVADVRDVLEDDRLVRQQRRGECRQSGVLVSRRPDRPPERVPPFHDQLRHLRTPAVAPPAASRPGASPIGPAATRRARPGPVESRVIYTTSIRTFSGSPSTSSTFAMVRSPTRLNWRETRLLPTASRNTSR